MASSTSRFVQNIYGICLWNFLPSSIHWKIQFVFLFYANQFKTKIYIYLPLTSSHEVFLFCLKNVFEARPFGLISMLSDCACNGIVEMHRESKLDGQQQQQKTHPKQLLHQMVVKQHIKLPMKFFSLWRRFVFFIHHERMILSNSWIASQLVHLHFNVRAKQRKKLFYLHFMSCFKIVNGNWISSYFFLPLAIATSIHLINRMKLWFQILVFGFSFITCESGAGFDSGARNRDLIDILLSFFFASKTSIPMQIEIECVFVFLHDTTQIRHGNEIRSIHWFLLNLNWSMVFLLRIHSKCIISIRMWNVNMNQNW